MMPYNRVVGSTGIQLASRSVDTLDYIHSGLGKASNIDLLSKLSLRVGARAEDFAHLGRSCVTKTLG